MGAQNMSKKYFNFKDGLTSKAKLLTLEELQALTIPKDKDAYVSIYYYNEDHKKKFEATNTLAGIKDVVTRSLVWDFDSATDISKAQDDVLELATRLVNNYGVNENDINCFYSSNKGFHVVVNIDREVNPEQFKQVTSKIAEGLSTYDSVVADPQRVLRMEHTYNPKSGLFKIPLLLNEVVDLDIEDIKTLAKTTREDFESSSGIVKLPPSLFVLPTKKAQLALVSDESYDYSNPPKGWKKYKWALAQGWFDEGERHQALLVIAATARGLNYDKETTYYICKSALKKQAQRTGAAEFPKEELWDNIIEKSVFSDNWSGGQYSVANSPWLKIFCERLGLDTDEKEEKPVVSLDDLIGQFIDYSTNFDQNIIKTGIAGLDDNLILSTSTLNGLLGQPGSGKTTVAIEILRNASINGIPSMFFSLDMGPPLVFSKLVQKETGINFKDVMTMYKIDQEKRDKVSQSIKDNYKNVGFNFKCGSTVEDLRRYINQQKEHTGLKPKLVVVDYMELVSGPYSDPTANAAIVAHGLKNLATEEEVCILLLLQTQKHSTPDISDPLLSLKQIKGSSALEQDCSVVLTLWREGYSPNTVKDDKYISFALVKNRFGSLWRDDFSWNPIRGNIRPLLEEEKDDLLEFKKRKKEEKATSAQNEDKW